MCVCVCVCVCVRKRRLQAGKDGGKVKLEKDKDSDGRQMEMNQARQKRGELRATVNTQREYTFCMKDGLIGAERRADLVVYQ